MAVVFLGKCQETMYAQSQNPFLSKLPRGLSFGRSAYLAPIQALYPRCEIHDVLCFDCFASEVLARRKLSK